MAWDSYDKLGHMPADKVQQSVAKSLEVAIDDWCVAAVAEKLGKKAQASPDISGLIGAYAHGNEPGHHTTFLFNYAGRPWKTQELNRQIQTTMYTNLPDGICGNEDCGQMSAWYIFSAMGFYPVNPAELKYQFGSPIVQEAKLEVASGKYFTMKAPLASKDKKYIQEVKLNGQVLNRSYITHQEIMEGGLLEFAMGDTPNKNLFQ